MSESDALVEAAECWDRELVWARMKWQIPWPALIVKAPCYFLNKRRKGNAKCVFFFGTHNFAWVKDIRSFYGPWHSTMLASSKRKNFLEAVQQVNQYRVNAKTYQYINNLVSYALAEAKLQAEMEGYDSVARPFPNKSNLNATEEYTPSCARRSATL